MHVLYIIMSMCVFPYRVGTDVDHGVSLDQGEARVYFWGAVVLSIPHNLRTSCSVDLRYFPFDNQTCTITYFVALPSEYTRIVRDAASTVPAHLIFEENTEWENIVPTLTNLNLTYHVSSELTESHSAVNLTITMKRVPTFYIIYLVIPSVVISFVSVMVFALPPESGERIGLSITSLLSYTVFLLMVSEVSPRGGKNMSLLGMRVFFSFSNAECQFCNKKKTSLRLTQFFFNGQ